MIVRASRCTQGIPSERIAEAATRVDADLVVVGPHNRYPQTADEVGRAAEALVQRSCAPRLRWDTLADGFPPYDRFGTSSPPAIRRLFHEVRRLALAGAAR